MRLRARIWRPGHRRGEAGQSLLETAVTLPLMLCLAFNAINFGYFWFMVLALAAAPRHGVEYASQGGAAAASSTGPTASGVNDLVLENITNAVHGATSSNTSVRVCSIANGTSGTGSSKVAVCTTYGPSYTYPTLTADPEAPTFLLHQVDVAYTVTQIIPGTAFNVVLPSNMQFHRKVAMRSLW